MSVLTEAPPAHAHLRRPAAGCFCTHCQRTRADRKASEYRRAVLTAAGLWKPEVDAGPARAHIELIRAQTGLGLTTIGNLSGAGASAVHVLVRGRMYLNEPPPTTIPEWRARKLLAFWPNLDQVPPHAGVDATGTHRRLQALAVNGWSMPALSPLVGVCHEELSKILYRRLVTAGTARKVRDLFKTMWAQQAPTSTVGERISSARARAHAARNGWVSALAWDDIDDPQAKPKGVRPKTERVSWRCECGRTLKLLADSGRIPDHSWDPARRADDQPCPAGGTTPTPEVTS